MPGIIPARVRPRTKVPGSASRSWRLASLRGGLLGLGCLWCSACGPELDAVAISKRTVSCDTGLDISAPEPLMAAEAMGLCQRADGANPGLVSASYVRADGSQRVQADGYGILSDFGPNVAPREGSALLALSSGAARTPGEPNYVGRYGDQTGDTVAAPPGFPRLPPACDGHFTVTPVQATANDSAGLELLLHTPSNAQALSFDFAFYTTDYPSNVCAVSDDTFAVFVDPEPIGALLGNVVFDSQILPISVNNPLIRVCHPPLSAADQALVRLGPPYFECPLGAAALQANGYEAGAATGWLTTRVPVAPDSDVRVRFMIWDAEDFDRDSTVLIDHFSWDVNAGATLPTTVPAQ